MFDTKIKSMYVEDLTVNQLVNINANGDVRASDVLRTLDDNVKIDLIIPSELNGIKVTGVGDYSFYGRKSLTSVVLPEGITKIGNSAFGNCTSLKSINIPSTVTSIGNMAFSLCELLTSVVIPSGVTSIEQQTFMSCTSLASVTIPNTVTEIGVQAFYNCPSLTSIFIPSSVTKIETTVFNECNSLIAIIIDKPLYSISGFPWYASNATVYWQPDPAWFFNADGMLGINDVFNALPYPFDLTIPSEVGGAKVTKIASAAFNGCTSLRSVFIPDNITKIFNNAFYRCTNLLTINIDKASNSITGSPWGATNTTINWLR